MFIKDWLKKLITQFGFTAVSAEDTVSLLSQVKIFKTRRHFQCSLILATQICIHGKKLNANEIK